MKQSTKIAKPSKDFPLTPHLSGRRCKKIRDVLRCFGGTDNPQATLDEWLRAKDYLLAGRTPPSNTDGPRVVDLCNHFMTKLPVAPKRRGSETGCKGAYSPASP